MVFIMGFAMSKKQEVISRAFCPFCNKGVSVEIKSPIGEGKDVYKWIVIAILLVILFFVFKFRVDVILSTFLTDKLNLQFEATSLLEKIMPLMITALAGGFIGYFLIFLDDDFPLYYRCKECNATLNDGIWSKHIGKAEVAERNK